MSGRTAGTILIAVLLIAAGATPAGGVGPIDGAAPSSELSSDRTAAASGPASQSSPGPTVASANGTTDHRVSVVIVFESHAVREAATFPDLSVNVTGGQDVAFMPVLYATVPENAIDAIDRRAGVAAVYRDVAVSNPDDDVIDDSTALTTQATEQQTPWGVDRIDAPEATRATADSARANVTVAVLDTGIDYTHPDLESVSWGANFSNGVEQTGLSTAMDNNGHGTGVAGVVAAADNDQGVVGVAPGTELYAIKVLDSDGHGKFSWIISGIEAAVSGEDGELGTADDADVISMSLGGAKSDDGFEDVVEYASEHALVVSAAGNTGNGDASVNNVTYPAKYSESIAVAATDQQDQTPVWSAEGSEIELSAPGVDVTTTARNGGTITLNGTSLSAPHVSGVAALVIARDIADGSRDLSKTAVRERLRNATVDIEAEGIDPKSGYGLVLADEALDVDSLDEPSFSIWGLSPGDTAVGPDERTDVSATVTNDGDLEGTQRISLVVNGTVVAERSVTLAGGASRTVSFTDVFGGLAAGEYEYRVSSADDEATATLTVLEPPNFSVSELSPTNASVVHGESMDVNATVENVGGVEGTQSIELRANGSVLDEQEQTLTPGANVTVSFENVSVDLQPGTYDFGVFSENENRSGEVTVRTPARFLITTFGPGNVSVTRGESVSVTATVENVGEVAGTQSIDLRVGGQSVQNESLTLAGGETGSVSFELPTNEVESDQTLQYGIHSVQDRRSASLSIESPVGFTAALPEYLVPGMEQAVTYKLENTGDKPLSNVSLSVTSGPNVTVEGLNGTLAGELQPGTASERTVKVRPDESFDREMLSMNATATVDGETIHRSDSIAVHRTAVEIVGPDRVQASPGTTVNVTYSMRNIGITHPSAGGIRVLSMSDQLAVSGKQTVYFGLGTPTPAPGESVNVTFEYVLPESASSTDHSVTVEAVLGDRPTNITTNITTRSVLDRFDQNDPTGTIDFSDVLDSIAAYNSGAEIGGEPVTFRDVLDVIQLYNVHNA